MLWATLRALEARSDEIILVSHMVLWSYVILDPIAILALPLEVCTRSLYL